ncbi:heavy metal translocating P-type ATPase [Methanomicrobium mobile]|uniref:heavy metal translocating P-type ATPase n=1 Tax=Methanomicrobium mobile TaxID=2205 RepID=UPI0005B27A61|nr:cation-translocating P-type ATPase [Methanomicrobium mobile]
MSHHEECGCGCTCGHDHEHHDQEHAEHDHDREHHDPHEHSGSHGCPCGCGHDHGRERDADSPWWKEPEYILLVIAGVTLLAALIGEYGGYLTAFQISALALVSAAFTGIPIIYYALKGLIIERRGLYELAGLAILGAVWLGDYMVAAEVGFILTLGEIAEDYGYSRSRRDIHKLASLHPKFGLIKRKEHRCDCEDHEHEHEHEHGECHCEDHEHDGCGCEDHGDEFIEVPVDDIEAGDIARIRPGDIVCADGIVISGAASMDESCITGESIAVDKAVGDMVYSGSVNLNGLIEIEVKRRGNDSTYSQILKLVHEAEERKPPSYPFIEKFLRYYTPITLIVAALILLVTGSIEKTITVIIVSCPCGILLATPSAAIAAIGAGARRGILFKSGRYLEEAGQINAVLFDKTGTLTTGKMTVTAVEAFGGVTKEEVITEAAIAENGLQHPVSKAVTDYAAETGIPTAASENADCIRTAVNNGMIAEFKENSKVIRVGNRRFTQSADVTFTDEAESAGERFSTAGYNTLFVVRNGTIIGIIGISDRIREESPRVISQLKDAGIRKLAILSGDKDEIVRSIAGKCGINSEDLYSGILPADKKEITEKYQKEGYKVCFVGDGVNDSPALAQADLGAAIASRENTAAIETAHAVILRDSLEAVGMLLKIGKTAVRTIKFNTAFAVLISAGLVILALLGIVTPVVGALGHEVAVMGVLVNSALLPLKLGR